MKINMKKNTLITMFIMAFVFSGYAQKSFSGEQEETLKNKLERQGISIGGIGDDPHQNDKDVVLSEAEKLLWKTDQLSNIDKPGTIHYEFERKGTMDDGFTDSVELDVYKIKENGFKSAAVEFFSGDRNQEVPPNENTNGNPVLGVYLQGDVYEMNRLTEGNWRYFHKRIKSALADDAKVEPVTIKVDGKDVSAEKVTITPYKNDPKRKMFEDYANKIYEFTVSDDVPGMLYKVHTIIPGTKKKGEPSEPLVEETLVYAGVDFEK